MRTDTEMLDWLSAQGFVSIRKSYNSVPATYTEEEKRTGGYNGHINFFTCHSQHLDGCENLRDAISKAMSMNKRA